MKQFSNYIKEKWPSKLLGNFQITIVSLVENGNRDTLMLHTNNNPENKYNIGKIKSDDQMCDVILTHQSYEKAQEIEENLIKNVQKSILPDLSNAVEVSQNEQVKLNHWVSTYDDSVNKNVYKLFLKRN